MSPHTQCLHPIGPDLTGSPRNPRVSYLPRPALGPMHPDPGTQATNCGQGRYVGTHPLCPSFQQALPRGGLRGGWDCLCAPLRGIQTPSQCSTVLPSKNEGKSERLGASSPPVCGFLKGGHSCAPHILIACRSSQVFFQVQALPYPGSQGLTWPV